MPEFPRNIFQVWFQGCKNMKKKELITNSRLWRDLNPLWKYHCIDDKFLRESCGRFSEQAQRLYDKMSLMHMKIDFARYITLYLYGGIYVDMDAFVLRPLDYSTYMEEIVTSYERTGKPIIGISLINANKLESWLYVHEDRIMNNAILVSSPGNPALQRFIMFIIANIESQLANPSTDAFSQIQSSTGPIQFNKFFAESQNLIDTDVVFLPPTIFEPCDLGRHDCVITTDTIAIHLFELSWLTGVMKYLSSVYVGIKSYVLTIVTGILWIVLFILLRRRWCRCPV
jgi:mannosyltransferase OCH1-like enzyme